MDIVRDGGIVRHIIMVIGALILAGCGGGSSDNTSYACTLPCLEIAPTLSTSTVSSATGGTVDVTVRLLGELTNIGSFNVSFSKIGSGNTVGLGVVWSPLQPDNVVSVTVNAGAEPGDYYPRIMFNAVSPNNTGSQYYMDSSKSSANYTYYEWVDGVASAAAVTPFAIPVLQIQ